MSPVQGKSLPVQVKEPLLDMVTCRLPSLSHECTKYISADNAREGLMQYIHSIYIVYLV